MGINYQAQISEQIFCKTDPVPSEYNNKQKAFGAIFYFYLLYLSVGAIGKNKIELVDSSKNKNSKICNSEEEKQINEGPFQTFYIICMIFRQRKCPEIRKGRRPFWGDPDPHYGPWSSNPFQWCVKQKHLFRVYFCMPIYYICNMCAHPCLTCHIHNPLPHYRPRQIHNPGNSKVILLPK